MAGILDGLETGKVLKWIDLLLEVLCAEIREAREGKNSLILARLLLVLRPNSHLYDLLLLNDVNLRLEEPATTDDLSVLYYNCFNLRLFVIDRFQIFV